MSVNYPQDAQSDPNFDWTTGQPIPQNDADIDDFEMAAPVFDRDAEEIEQDRARREPPAGDHEFAVTGFWKKPEPVTRYGHFNGQQVSWIAWKVGVRLAMVADTAATVLDFFDLPPNDQREQTYYLHASKNADGKNPGFMAEKFGHFISRLGWPYPKGSPIPPEARKIGNWKGRRIVATIELTEQKDPNTGEAKYNPTTGEPYPPRAQVKLFSYRPSASTLAGSVPAPTSQTARPAPQHQQPQQPRQQQAAPRPQPQPTTAPPPTGQQPQRPGYAPPSTDRLAALRGQL